jgi:transcriptional regulator NrdR family protein
MQLKVIKADGTEEGYLHTKVIAAFVNAFARPEENSTSVAHELAEAVTFYLYSKYGRSKITSSEILSIIQAVLSSTGHDDAAANLAEHHRRRDLLRARVEVTKSDIQKISDALKLQQDMTAQLTNRWNKSKIINELVTEYNLDSTTARTVASMVEEKILASGFRTVPSAFIRFLVLLQTQAILSAQQQLQPGRNVKETVLSSSRLSPSKSVNNAVMDERLRQPQNGLCPVEV